MPESFANFYSSLLNGAIDDNDTSLVVDSATGSPAAPQFRAVIQDSETDDTNRELVIVTAKSGTTFTITRGAESTTAVAHGDNSYIAAVLTSDGLAQGIAEAPDVVRVNTGQGSIRIPGLAADGAVAGYLGGGAITEEYDTATTGLTWNTTPNNGVNSDTNIPSHLYMDHTFSGAGSIYGLRAFAPSDGYEAFTKITVGMNDSANTVGIGVMVAASGSTPTSAWGVTLNLTRTGCSIIAASLATTTWTQRGSTWAQRPAVIYFRLSRATGTNDHYAWWSEDGQVWTYITTFNLALTVAQLGYRITATNSALIRASSDFLRTNV